MLKIIKFFNAFVFPLFLAFSPDRSWFYWFVLVATIMNLVNYSLKELMED